MLYDVSVTRTSTATLTIRVVADDPENARGKALELAGDTDFMGCVVEYDFDANDAVEVKDESPPDCADETLLDGHDVADKKAHEVLPRTDETCALCPTVFPGVSDEIIDAGWVPSYWIGEEEQEGPVCPNCARQFLVTDPQYGESVLCVKGEYVSQWDGGVEVRAACVVAPRTRRTEIESTADVEGLETLEREYVVLNGKEYPAANEEERFQYSADEQAGMFFYE
jgi:hypothetical protein